MTYAESVRLRRELVEQGLQFMLDNWRMYSPAPRHFDPIFAQGNPNQWPVDANGSPV